MNFNNPRAAILAAVILGGVICLTLVGLRLSSRSVHSELYNVDVQSGPKPAAAQGGNQSASPTPIKDRRFEERRRAIGSKVSSIANTPVNFFGKVVDQDGNPIAGAQTRFIVGSLSFYGSPTEDGPTTDSSGKFAITGRKGPNLTVAVQHQDYYPTNSAERRFEYAAAPYATGKQPAPLPTENNPATFVLYRKGQSEALVHQKITARVPMDGRVVPIDLVHGRTAQTAESVTLSLESDGDKLPLNEFYPFDWALTIEVPNGGVVTRGGTLDFEAPAGGYESSLKVLMPTSIGAANWKSRLDQEFFVLFSTGRYGRFRLGLSAEKGTGYLESYLNPTPGDRNLEFDPAKEIKVK